jgi:hypothetical protein
MDRGIPTEETLAQMRASSPPASYLVGTQMQHTPVNDPARQRFQQIGMRNGPEVVRQVGIDHVRTHQHRCCHQDPIAQG